MPLSWKKKESGRCARCGFPILWGQRYFNWAKSATRDRTTVHSSCAVGRGVPKLYGSRPFLSVVLEETDLGSLH